MKSKNRNSGEKIDFLIVQKHIKFLETLWIKPFFSCNVNPNLIYGTQTTSSKCEHVFNAIKLELWKC